MANPYLRVRKPVSEESSGLFHITGPSPTGTFLLICGLLLTGYSLPMEARGSEIATYAAWGVAVSLGASLFADFLQGGVPNLIRADVMALFSLYFLTLFEFLGRQPHFDEILDARTVPPGVIAVLWGFAGIALGRHLVNQGVKRYIPVFNQAVPSSVMMAIFAGAMIIGYFYQFYTCHFNPLEVFHWYMEPRFTQPWGRGRLGDAKALVGELNMLTYLLSPLAGVMFAKRSSYNRIQLALVAFGFLWNLAAAFLAGTRNVFDSNLVTFMIAYIFALGGKRSYEIVVVVSVSVVLLLVSTRMMLGFRNIGFTNYISGQAETERVADKHLFVDMNLWVICGLVQVFPERAPYLGTEVPYLALIRPVPRALWAGKPEGMSLSIEDAMGVQGLTLASSFVGEGYMTYGNVGVFLFGFFFGGMAGWWSCLATPRNSDLGILIYASGFFSTVISMRSLFVFTTAILPTVAAIIGGSLLIQKLRERRRSSFGGTG